MSLVTVLRASAGENVRGNGTSPPGRISNKVHSGFQIIRENNLATFTLTSGNDTRNQIGQGTADVIDALEGQDFVSTGNLNDSVLGGQGDDTLFDVGGTNTLDGGTGNDSIRVTDSVGLLFGNDGGDTINAVGSFGVTIAGGRDSSDAADSLVGSSFNDFILGNGGADIINGGGEWRRYPGWRVRHRQHPGR